MQKDKKGFTLIELLAVIVILAVIALIATPLIMNVINDAKKGAARDAGYNVIKAGELKAATSGIENQEPPYHYDENSDLPMKGTKPTKFTLDINENMDTQLKAWLNGYCVVKEYGSETVTIDESKKTESDCVKVTYRKYDNGTAIYFNPETNTKCSSSDYTPNNSLNENKSGCMKWYAFNDSESSSTVNVLLDHNTTVRVAWNTSGQATDGMKEVKEALESDTKTWNTSLKPRLIEANEIAKIVGNTEFDATVKGKDNVFSFPKRKTNSSEFNNETTISEYAWLFDYTEDCIKHGCSISDENVWWGYWTSTSRLSVPTHAFEVNSSGDVGSYIVSGAGYGVRPVVTISKSILQ